MTDKHGSENFIANGLGIPAHDYIANTYDGGGNLSTVTYRFGGATGDIVAVLDLAYDGSNRLTSVTRST